MNADPNPAAGANSLAELDAKIAQIRNVIETGQACDDALFQLGQLLERRRKMVFGNIQLPSQSLPNPVLPSTPPNL